MRRPVFRYDDTSYRVGDLKAREVEALETQLGCRYGEINPMGTMRHKVALSRAFLVRDHPVDKVERILDEMTLDQIDDCWDVEDDDLPDVYEDGIPNSGGEPSTPGS